MSSNIKVVVRCRPLNARELARGAKGLVRMEGNNTYLDPPEAANVSSGRATEKETKSFAFDKSYWSAGPRDDPAYASQQTVYEDLGKDLLDHSFEGFNTCIFAYGQTGSGKSYTMMGYGADRGIIPLICEALFERIHALTSDTLSFTVEVSYTEIYQEKVRDLLNPNNKGNLKVREHPSLGPYVESLSKLAVENFADVEGLMDEGTKARTVAATNMNETSSRSHAVFTLLLTQRRHDVDVGMAGEKVSRISLVDLAGSERANATGATGTRLKEGALINKSLTTLGRVISALAGASSGGRASRPNADKVPYRDSVLTWLLKDSLGGNSKTAMIAAISPADYEETLSTLRYADQAKKIKNKAVINEDPNAKLIRELKEELATLRQRMTAASASGGEDTYDPSVPPERQIVTYRTQTGELKTITKAELQDQLEQSEQLMASVTETWEQKLVKTQEIQKEREQALEALGITIEKNLVGVYAPKKMPSLVNLDEDPLASECLVYQIKPGRTTVGSLDQTVPADLRLSGSNIQAEHCYFEHGPDGKVILYALPNATTLVNGQRLPVGKPRELQSGFRIILGDFHVFRFKCMSFGSGLDGQSTDAQSHSHPEQVRKARDAKAELRSPLLDLDDGNTSSPATRPESPMSTAENADWSYARREAVVARLNGSSVNLEELRDDDLDKLYSSILKVRHSRTASSATSGDRPESRMSLMDSVAEDSDDDEGNRLRDSPSRRPVSTSTWSTEPTSVGDSTMTLSHGPDLDERLLAVKEEYEDRLKAMTNSTVQVDEIMAEKLVMAEKLKSLETHLATQKQRYEKRVKRLMSGTSNGELDDMDILPLTAQQRELASATLERWRQLHRVRMAEEILSQAVTVKEANVLSRELKKGVTIQLTIIERDVPLSAGELIAGLGDIEASTDQALYEAVKPCVGVKVLDRRNRAVYSWSMHKFQQRLLQMRNMHRWIDKPEYSRHFSSADPFYESPTLPGGFSFVGSASVSLALLSRNLPSSNVVPIYSPYTADPLGTMRVRIRPLSVRNPDQPGAPLGPGSRSSLAPFFEGSVVTFEVTVDKVSDLYKGDFTAVHLQTQLAPFLGGPVQGGEEDAIAGDVIDLTQGSCREIRVQREFEIVLTPTVHRHLTQAYAPIDVFGRVTPAHLDKIERWDEARDSSTTSKVPNLDPLRGDPLHGNVTRRPESELISEQVHDVVANIEIRELGEGGEYVPVQVITTSGHDTGAFFLRQGLQRRIVLNLTHNSGRGWIWKKISKVTLGNVRMLDSRGRLHAATATADVELRGMGHPRATFNADGIAALSFAAAWDSSVHDSPHLNRNTASNSRALVGLAFEVEVDNCIAPVPFSMDIAVTVQSRDARGPSKLSTLFSSARLASKVTSVFSVKLIPALTRKPTDVWRLNTADVFVRGEELVSHWKPRGLSLLRDLDQVNKEKRKTADVEAAKAILAAFELTLPGASESISSEDRLSSAIALWQKRFGTQDEISFDKKEESSPATIMDLSPGSTPAMSRTPSASGQPGLTGTASLVAKNGIVIRKGPLAILRDPTSNRWNRFYVVLRRPYLYLYESPVATNEVSVINLSTVRVEQNAEIERMLERKFAFAIFTHQNSYFLSTQSQHDMLDWMKAIDPSLA